MSNQAKFVQLQERHRKSSEVAIQINTKIEGAQEQYKKLAQVAQEKYGTSNIEDLKALRDQWQRENDEQIAQYEQDVLNLEKEVTQKSQLIKQIQQSAS